MVVRPEPPSLRREGGFSYRKEITTMSQAPYLPETARPGSVTFFLQTADKTRRAQVTAGRHTRVLELAKVGADRWSLDFGFAYQIANITTGRLLLPLDNLSLDRVQD